MDELDVSDLGGRQRLYWTPPTVSTSNGTSYNVTSEWVIGTWDGSNPGTISFLDSPPPPAPQGGSMLTDALDKAALKADEEILKRWAGNPDIAKVYDALLEGRKVVDVRNLVAYHRCQDSSRGWFSHFNLVVAPVGAKKVEALWSGRNLTLETYESSPMRSNWPGWLQSGATALRTATWSKVFNTTCATSQPLTNWAAVPVVPDAIETKPGDLVFFEAAWERPDPVPRDPALLRPVAGSAFEVIMVWDLTPLEAAALAKF